MKLFSAQKLTALSLIVFLSSACCLFCCGINAFASDHCDGVKMAQAMATEMAGEAMPAGHCDKMMPKGGSLIAVTTQSPDKTTPCSFVSKRADLAQKQSPDSRSVANKAVQTFSLQHVFLTAPSFLTQSYKSVIRDRGGTYLKNCVFRI